MVITIGGEYGSGAKRIAEDAAKALGYRLCDNDIIAQAAKEAGVDVERETYAYYDESEGSSPVAELSRASNIVSNGIGGAISSLTFDIVPLDRRIADSQRKILNDLADQGNCIILGRCADYYLQGRTDVVRIWAFNTMEKRVDRISKFFSISERDAAKLIRKTDKRRADYYEYFTKRRWRDFENYDFTLNVDTVGIKRGIEFLQKLAEIGDKTLPDPEVRTENTARL